MGNKAARWAREGLLIGGLLVLLVVGTTFAQVRQVPPRVPLDAFGYALLVVATLILAGRVRWPRAVFVSTVLLTGAYLAVGYAYGPVFFSVAVAAFYLADAVTAGVSVVAALVGMVFLVLCEAPRTLVTGDATTLVAPFASFTMFFVVPLWLASIRSRAVSTATAGVERRRRELGEQRLELAREVHDVVGHSLAVIGIQAGAALRAFDRDPQRARDALSAIASTNRQALTELRDTINLLCDPGVRGRDPVGTGEDGPLAGGLADLSTLVDNARAAGVDVRLTLGFEARRDAPTLVERTAYRIGQESLTNALRHAPGAAVRIAVNADATALTVDVSDDGPGLGGRPEGRGITGMRERAAWVGGSVALNEPDSGGVTVSARLPIVVPGTSSSTPSSRAR